SKKALLWTRQMFYEKSNKADSLLANRLKKKRQRNRITVINTSDGQTQNLPEQIAETFTQFYTSLYDHDPQSRHNAQDTE
ncbi:Hypothetical predicted protein, partial [Pelobates cultripes]